MVPGLHRAIFRRRDAVLPFKYAHEIVQLHSHHLRDFADGSLEFLFQQLRAFEQAEALQRLQALVRSVCVTPKRRVPTKPTQSAVRKRLETKKKLGQIKKLRRQRPDPF